MLLSVLEIGIGSYFSNFYRNWEHQFFMRDREGGRMQDLQNYLLKKLKYFSYVETVHEIISSQNGNTLWCLVSCRASDKSLSSL